MSAIGKFHVVMKFGDGLTGWEQANMMLQAEQAMIKFTGKPVQVFKETMADDSKLRNMMTDEQRAKL